MADIRTRPITKEYDTGWERTFKGESPRENSATPETCPCGHPWDLHHGDGCNECDCAYTGGPIEIREVARAREEGRREALLDAAERVQTEAISIRPVTTSDRKAIGEWLRSLASRGTTGGGRP